MYKLPHHRMTPAFTSKTLRQGALPMGHLLNVDHFQMSEATFPPHPHAGFSAVTWIMPWSAGGFINRDSEGNHMKIAPGAIHWTLAGSGMIHEEIPEQPGVVVEGLQIFVKLPEQIEMMEPASFHIEPEEMPTVALAGGVVRVLVGELDGASSPIPSHARTTMLHAEVTGELRLEVPRGVEAFVMVLRGSGELDGVAAEAGVASAISAEAVTLKGDDLHALIAWGDPMPTLPTFSGPLCMFRPERITAARAAYASGAMGQLAPSNARWVR